MASVHRGVTPEVHVPGAWKACDCAGHAEGSSNDIPHQSLFVLSSLRFFGTLPRITFFLSFSRIVEDVLRVSPAKRFFSCIRLYLNNQRMFNFLSTNWGDSVLVTDRECPDRCKFPIYTVALFFPNSCCRSVDCTWRFNQSRSPWNISFNRVVLIRMTSHVREFRPEPWLLHV